MEKGKSVLDERGHEVLDPTPVAMPLNFRRPPSINEQIRMMVRNEMSRAAQQMGEETFEEADDFDTGEDPELSSKYELDDEQLQYKEPEPKTDTTPAPPVPPKKDAPAPAPADDEGGDE